MLTCRQASELLSHSLDEDLSWPSRARLRLHVMLCNCCASLEDNLQTLRGTIGRQQPHELDEAELDRLESLVHKTRKESNSQRQKSGSTPPEQ